jgi:hypothetical protein
MYYMHIKFNTHKITLVDKYLQFKLFNKRYELAGGRRGLGLPLEDYFLQVQTSLELWPSSDVSATTIAFLRAYSFFLLALI